MLRKITIFAIVTILVALILTVVGYRMLFPTLPKPQHAREITWLDQGWSADQRGMWYKASQGSLIIPFSWFLALENPETGNHELFHTDENMLRYDLILDSYSKYDPDHLPIGILKQSISEEHLRELGCGSPPCPPGSSLHREWLTYTCAACHTAQINYKGKTFGVDGARGRWNFTVFNTTLANLLLVTSLSPPMFDRFAPKVLARERRRDTPEERAKVKKELREFLKSPPIVDAIVAGIKQTYPTEEGFGRMDALGRGSNGQFSVLDPRNILRGNAPVLIPPLWYTHDFDWVQTVAGIRSPLGRNITESWGVNSAVDLANPDPAKRFHSSIPMQNMFFMETLLSVLTPPVWPDQILGKVDTEAVKLGQYLFEEKVFDNALSPAEEQWCADSPGPPGEDGWQTCPNPGTPKKGLCARCHAAVPETYANESGKRYWQLPMYKLSVLGTDPWDAANFNGREVYTGVLREAFGGKEKVGIGEALLRTTSAVIKTELGHQRLTPDDPTAATGYRKNNFRAPLGYPARPLPGYWATPPYLHNGAVPNMYELLSPLDERSASFWTGDLEFDTVHLGYQSASFEGGFEFVTRRSFLGAVGSSFRQLLAGHLEFNRDIAGNSNMGHEFRNAPKGTKGVIGPMLTPKERMAIIEYLKVMPELKPLDDGADSQKRRDMLKVMEREFESASQK
jgi:hypothetical protein